jgi:hypothetical protein
VGNRKRSHTHFLLGTGKTQKKKNELVVGGGVGVGRWGFVWNSCTVKFRKSIRYIKCQISLLALILTFVYKSLLMFFFFISTSKNLFLPFSRTFIHSKIVLCATSYALTDSQFDIECQVLLLALILTFVYESLIVFSSFLFFLSHIYPLKEKRLWGYVERF